MCAVLCIPFCRILDYILHSIVFLFLLHSFLAPCFGKLSCDAISSLHVHMLPLEMKLHGRSLLHDLPPMQSAFPSALCTDLSAIVFCFLIYFLIIMLNTIYMMLLSFQADTLPASPVVHLQLSLPEAASLCSDPIRNKLRTFNTHQLPRPETPLSTLSIPARFTYNIADRENLAYQLVAIDYADSFNSTICLT